MEREYFAEFIEKFIKYYMCCEDLRIPIAQGDHSIILDESVELSSLDQGSIISFSDAYTAKAVAGLEKLIGDSSLIDSTSLSDGYQSLDDLNMIVICFTVNICDIPIKFTLAPSRYDDRYYVFSDFKIVRQDLSLSFSDYVLTRKETPAFIFRAYDTDMDPVYSVFLDHKPLSYLYDTDITMDSVDKWLEITNTITDLCFDE